jgi:hypothetical protein
MENQPRSECAACKQPTSVNPVRVSLVDSYASTPKKLGLAWWMTDVHRHGVSAPRSRVGRVTVTVHVCSQSCADDVNARAQKVKKAEAWAGRPAWPDFIQMLREKQPEKLCAMCDAPTGHDGLPTPLRDDDVVAYTCRKGPCSTAMFLLVDERIAGRFRCSTCGRVCSRENDVLLDNGIIVARACSPACLQRSYFKAEAALRSAVTTTAPAVDASVRVWLEYWLEYPWIETSRNSVVLAHKVFAIETALLDRSFAKGLGIVPKASDIEDEGDIVIAKALVETNCEQRQWVRLPVRLSRWAMEAVEFIKRGYLSYPFTVSLVADENEGFEVLLAVPDVRGQDSGSALN